MTAMSSIRLEAAGMLAGLSLLLSGCFLQAGKFTSQLTLLGDNEFTFTYEGEIHFVGLAKMIEEQQNRRAREFTAYCYGPLPEELDALDAAANAAEAAAEAAEEVSDAAPSEERVTTVAVAEAADYGSRECTAEEEAEQRAEWEERWREREKEQMDQFSKIFGGIDPSDPEAEKELAKRLERQEGFDKVVSKGDGLFEVSYSINGTLDHDFAFPMMEGFPTGNAFVQVFVRDGNVVRVNAPGFASPSNGNPMFMYLLGAPGFGGGNDRDELLRAMPKIDGTFTIVTDGDIRANNTDEGPTSEGGRQTLTWRVDSRSQSAPTALIAMP